MEYKLLSKIKSPDDVKKLNYDEISLLCREIRDCIVSTVSKNGGYRIVCGTYGNSSVM